MGKLDATTGAGGEDAVQPGGQADAVRQRGDDDTLGRVLGLAALVAALAVAPSALWFGHHRAALGIGLNHYLTDQTLESVDRARENYRIEALRRHGTGPAPAGDRSRRRFREEPEPEEGWVLRALRPIVAPSELANQLMVYRALPPATADHVLSLRGVFSGTFGYDVGGPLWAPSERGSGGFLVTILVSVVGLALLIAAMAYSVCAACTVDRRRRSLTKLPELRLGLVNGTPSVDRPLRAIVVHRGERRSDDFDEELTRHLDLWRPDGSAPRGPGRRSAFPGRRRSSAMRPRSGGAPGNRSTSWTT